MASPHESLSLWELLGDFGAISLSLSLIAKQFSESYFLGHIPGQIAIDLPEWSSL